MSNNLTNSASITQRLGLSFVYCLAFVALLWLIEWLEWHNGWKLSEWGLYPRRYWGLLGILTAPLLHGDWAHLASNSFPILLLGSFTIYAFPESLRKGLLIWLWLGSGIWTWIFAREAYHIGASGVVYGLAGFLFFRGVFSPDRSAMAFSFIVILLYSGMLGGLLPNDQHISWESHLSGLLVGAGFAYAYRYLDLPIQPSFRTKEQQHQQIYIEGVYRVDEASAEEKPLSF